MMATNNALQAADLARVVLSCHLQTEEQALLDAPLEAGSWHSTIFKNHNRLEAPKNAIITK